MGGHPEPEDVPVDRAQRQLQSRGQARQPRGAQPVGDDGFLCPDRTAAGQADSADAPVLPQQSTARRGMAAFPRPAASSAAIRASSRRGSTWYRLGWRKAQEIPGLSSGSRPRASRTVSGSR